MKGIAAAVAVRVDEGRSGTDAVATLRRRLAGASAREHALLDFLSEDLRGAREAVAAIAAHLDEVERTLAEGRITSEGLAGLARASDPVAPVDRLGGALRAVRRRLAQLAART